MYIRYFERRLKSSSRACSLSVLCTWKLEGGLGALLFVVFDSFNKGK